MLWAVLAVILILWLLGFIGGVGGSLAHLLLAVALNWNACGSGDTIVTPGIATLGGS